MTLQELSGPSYVPSHELSDQAMTDWLQEITARVREGGYQVDFIPLAVYEWMDSRGGISTTPAEKHEYLVKAADYRLAQLSEAVENNRSEINRQQLAEFAGMRRAGEFAGVHIQDLKNLAKKMLLFDMLLRSGTSLPAGDCADKGTRNFARP